jgi:hypothetical protein
MTGADWGLLCDTATAGGPLTMTLPLSPTTGLVEWFKNLGTSTCTIGGNGKNIDGSATLAIANQNDADLIQYDGAQWRIIAKPAASILGANNVFSGLNNMSQQIVTKAIPYTMTLADWGLLCDTATAGGPLTMTLPLSPTTGLVEWFKNLGTSTCTIGGNGKNIDGSATLAVVNQNDADLIQYDGAQWRIIAKPAAAGTTIGQGAYASLPAACTTGNAYFFTDSLFTVARCSATNTWSYFYDGKTIAPAATMTLSNGLQTGVTTSNSRGYETLAMPVGGAATLSYRFWTAPTAPYIQYVFLRLPYVPDTSNTRCFAAGFQDGANAQNTLKLCTGAAVENGMWWQVTFGTSGAQTGSDAFGNAAIPPSAPFGDVVLALQNDGANLHWGVSGDGGDTFTELFTTSKTTHFSTGPTVLFYGGYNSAATFPTKLTFVGVR